MKLSEIKIVVSEFEKIEHMKLKPLKHRFTDCADARKWTFSPLHFLVSFDNTVKVHGYYFFCHKISTSTLLPFHLPNEIQTKLRQFNITFVGVLLEPQTISHTVGAADNSC